jgi:peptide-methionine (R)-S-oxide reductase
MVTRRFMLWGGAAVAALAGLRWVGGADAQAASFEIDKPDSEWRRILSPAQFAVLRHHGTERPYSSPLNAEKRAGAFACAGCDLPVFSSATKFESGTGWPSFYQPLANAVGTSVDTAYFIKRTEVHCRRCGGHFGHVFDDGPRPTGLRYCMNGVALTFVPGDAPPA